MLPRTGSSDVREVWWISPIEPLRDELAAFCKKSVQWDGRACQLDVVEATADKGAHPSGHGAGQGSRELSVRSCMGYGAVAGAHGSR